MTVYAIGAKGLTGGTSGCLDYEPVDDLHDGDPAIVFVEGDAVYFYIGDASSGAAESSPDVIEPDFQSAGVAYTGDYRWILTDVIKSHNALTGLQGGTTDQYYHLLLAEYTELTDWLDNVTLGSDGQTEAPQMVLTPRASALNDIQGGMYYSNVDDGVYVCTSDS